jgi:hypothetical protein
MAKTSDWYPLSRTGQLAMAKNWITIVTPKTAAWGIPPDARSDYGVRIYYGLSGEPTEARRFRAAPSSKTGRDLPESLFTRRKKERFDFDGESGKTAYFCLQYETPSGGDAGKGPFGPILSAVIP